MDSNETLYGGDPKFLAEINKLCETLIGQILDHLKAFGRDEVSETAGNLSFSIDTLICTTLWVCVHLCLCSTSPKTGVSNI